MTSTSTSAAGNPPVPHAREIELRRLRAGELGADERARLDAHLGGCAPCRGKLGALEEEQRAFAQEISFERFAGGVERAARVPSVSKAKRPLRWFATAALGLAAAAALVLVLRPGRPTDDDRSFSSNTLKGAAVDANLRIGAGDGRTQRVVAAGAAARLGPGDLFRLGYRTDRPRHLVALAVDDQGVVSALYPTSGPSLAVASSAAVTYLPDAIALEGQGHERVFLVLAGQSFTVEQATAAVRAEQKRTGGDLRAMASPALPDAQIFTWLLEKP